MTQPENQGERSETSKFNKSKIARKKGYNGPLCFICLRMVDSSTSAGKQVTHKFGPVLEKDYEPLKRGEKWLELTKQYKDEDLKVEEAIRSQLEYAFIVDRSQMGTMYKQGGDYVADDGYDIEKKVGTFQPTPEFFERVPEWVTGELVVSHEHSDGPEITLEVTGGDPNDQTILMHEDGNTEIAPEQVIDRTGIIVSVSELESIFLEEN